MTKKNLCQATTLVALSYALLTSAVTQAAIQTFALNDTNAPRDTGWSMRYDDSQVTVTSFLGVAGTGNLQGTLSITKVFSTMSSISIEFIESAAQQASGSPFGLRINLVEEITNLTGADWTGFTMDLQDPSAVSEQSNSAHPGFAHFHPAPGPIDGTPFSLTTANGGNKASTLEFANGVFANNATNLWTGFGLHQYEDDGVDRSFTLVETPHVPEPASLGIWGLLAFTGAAYSFWRRRSAT